jgi:GNAT superfamily N-acetyltransferase
VDELPERCRRCLFWELGANRPAQGTGPDDAADRVRKQGWVTAQSLEDGAPGVLARDGRSTVGYALFGPAGVFAPRQAVPPTSHDALLLATAWVDPTRRGGGVGRVLVRAAVREAIRLDLRAVEAYGDRRARDWDCVVPVGWLLEEGFQVTAEHPRYPLLRIDVNRVARWAESLEHAVEELLGRAGAGPALEPARQVTLTPISETRRTVSP